MMNPDALTAWFALYGKMKVNDNAMSNVTLEQLYEAFKSRIEAEAALRLFPNEKESSMEKFV